MQNCFVYQTSITFMAAVPMTHTIWRERDFEFIFNLLLQAYVESDSKKRNVLELALQANEELHKQRAETEAGILRAHGNT
jgi:hypothetical protein